MPKKQLDNLVLENAQLIFRPNFSGREEKFNPAGKRNFCVVIPDEMVEVLKKDGWNLRETKPRDPEDTPLTYLQVSVAYTNFPPKIWLVTSKNKVLLDEESVGTLDFAEMKNVDVIITPYAWEVNGASGVKAYVKTMYVTIEEDQFADKYASSDSAATTSHSIDEDIPF